MRQKIRQWIIMCSVVVVGFFFMSITISAQEKNISVYGNEMTDATMTVGDTGKIVLMDEPAGNPEEMIKTYSVDDEEAVRVNEDGSYEALKPAQTVLTVRIYNKERIEIYCGVVQLSIYGDVTNTTLKKKSARLILTSSYENKPIKIGFNNLPDLSYYQFRYTSSNPSIGINCEFDTEEQCLVISAYSPGTAKLTILLNEKPMELTVTCYLASINKISLVLAKKKTATLKTKGYKGKVKWKTTNKKICTVTQKGIVKAKKKIGTAVVYYEIDGIKVGCAISVVTPALKKTVSKAYSIAKGKYDQKRRMQKGYYDCSSLVWRAYQKAGKSLGNKNYAPVAADIAKYLFQKKKKIKGGLSVKNINKMKLRPGDLYFEGGAKNGRYKGIYHVEMFTGYACGGFDASGKPMLYACFAARPIGYYYSGMMARP